MKILVIDCFLTNRLFVNDYSLHFLFQFKPLRFFLSSSSSDCPASDSPTDCPASDSPTAFISHVIFLETPHFRHTPSLLSSVMAASCTSLTGCEIVFCHGCSISYGEFCYLYTANIESLVTLCRRHGVLAVNHNCVTCGELRRIDITRKSFRCDKTHMTKGRRRKRCNYVKSIFHKTWFDHTKLDIETNLKFVLLWVQDWWAYKVARTELGLSLSTIVDWCSFCREVVVDWSLKQDKAIGGVGLHVEIDESKFGKRKYNVGRVIEGQWVFGGICRETRELFMVPVPTRDRDTLLGIIKEKILPGTTIISDCWKAYDCLENEGYKHFQVNHSVNFVDPDTLFHTNNIERKWRDTKILVPRFGRRNYHFVGYLARAMFKLYYTDPLVRFHHFLKQCKIIVKHQTINKL